MDIATFNRYNPDFDNMMSLNGNYDLRLPSDKMQLFLANKYVILNECVQLLLGDSPEPPPNQSTTYPKPKIIREKVSNIFTRMLLNSIRWMQINYFL
ncbi:MAG: hypothetical protein IPF72_13185 [Chitinophagaceae bacterium]|nr:hypothetical protein [Chitinophagaceae bacterium]